MPRTCTTCRKKVKGHVGPTGALCTGSRPETPSPSPPPPTAVPGLPDNFNDFTVEQLREFAMNSQKTVNTMQAASIVNPGPL